MNRNVHNVVSLNSIADESERSWETVTRRKAPRNATNPINATSNAVVNSRADFFRGRTNNNTNVNRPFGNRNAQHPAQQSTQQQPSRVYGTSNISAKEKEYDPMDINTVKKTMYDCIINGIDMCSQEYRDKVRDVIRGIISRIESEKNGLDEENIEGRDKINNRIIKTVSKIMTELTGFLQWNVLRFCDNCSGKCDICRMFSLIINGRSGTSTSNDYGGLFGAVRVKGKLGIRKGTGYENGYIDMYIFMDYDIDMFVRKTFEIFIRDYKQNYFSMKTCDNSSTILKNICDIKQEVIQSQTDGTELSFKDYKLSTYDDIYFASICMPSENDYMKIAVSFGNKMMDSNDKFVDKLEYYLIAYIMHPKKFSDALIKSCVIGIKQTSYNIMAKDSTTHEYKMNDSVAMFYDKMLFINKIFEVEEFDSAKLFFDTYRKKDGGILKDKRDVFVSDNKYKFRKSEKEYMRKYIIQYCNDCMNDANFDGKKSCFLSVLLSVYSNVGDDMVQNFKKTEQQIYREIMNLPCDKNKLMHKIVYLGAAIFIKLCTGSNIPTNVIEYIKKWDTSEYTTFFKFYFLDAIDYIEKSQ